ncbi:RNA polymerase factor sigma-54 [Alkalilimnicola ehrlichii]|uniref:RNA polymerase sigma-54 factor n=1 Tax=Alkalilimnicola ehrlichii TaxID=351052 RepID=A0A3E0X0T8_9GAMM|nr:RNA polymerase factor sigma-54 [Alkalilimnicola ehrlichii]RFA30286.1 RNA polymerase factor sigma-54 [Alkalilimnicola ehrlichii]RFA37865.1 RNA polymerase factor sigma-54 [Alkalilimnicola ehrlichii]
MKQSLQIRLGQQLTMTPQLQQAIRLLQLSSLDLQTEIQQALDSNLMLEVAEDVEARSDEAALSVKEPQEAAAERNDHDSDIEHEAASVQNERENIPDELPVDSDWQDVYDGSSSYSAGDPDSQRDLFENQADSEDGLREHLSWQANLSRFSERDAAIAEAIIDAIREDGYLGCSLEDIQATLPPDWEVEADEIEVVLHRIQRFDPVGVAARDPQEALLIQLRVLDLDSPWQEKARELVEKHLDLLVNRQYAQLMRRIKLSEEELKAVITLIQGLDPRPGSQFSAQRAQYVIPDVYVRKVRGVWRVELNRETAPKIRINNYYASLVRRADNSADNTTLRNHLQEARWFLKSLQSRNETLVKVANCIVKHQQGFLEQGEEAMQPLVLREVAEEVDMHESTISRITTQKYMHTPRGTFEFKYFFSSHVQTADGGECSATAIRARIRRLIAAEDARRPLSDSKLAEILRDEGINVARRTVAKYREAMSIASSTERKRLA